MFCLEEPLKIQTKTGSQAQNRPMLSKSHASIPHHRNMDQCKPFFGSPQCTLCWDCPGGSPVLPATPTLIPAHTCKANWPLLLEHCCGTELPSDRPGISFLLPDEHPAMAALHGLMVPGHMSAGSCCAPCPWSPCTAGKRSRCLHPCNEVPRQS